MFKKGAMILMAAMLTTGASLGETFTPAPGVQCKIIKEGKEGTAAKKGDKVTVHYTGTLLNGTKFDSSKDHGEPFKFQLGQGRVIQGWEIGVEGMKEGECRELTIAPECAYGSRDNGPIPANSTLKFVVDMIKVG